MSPHCPLSLAEKAGKGYTHTHTQRETLAYGMLTVGEAATIIPLRAQPFYTIATRWPNRSYAL